MNVLRSTALRCRFSRTARRRFAVSLGAIAASVLAASCELFQFAPQLTITTDASYPSPNVSFTYSMTSPSAGPFASSEQCAITVFKQTSLGLLPVSTMTQQLQPPSGTANTWVASFSSTFPSGGNYVPDGTYKLRVSVLAPDGTAIPVLTADSKEFSVLASGSEVITQVDPPVLNVTAPNASAIPIKVTGLGFTPTTVLTIAGGAATISATNYVSATELDATVNVSSLTPPAYFALALTDTNLTSSPQFSLEATGTLTLASVLPDAASTGTPNQPLLLRGSAFNAFTTVSVTDSAGNDVPVTENYQLINDSSMPIYLDLSHAAAGAATITLTNLDGTGYHVQAPFTINPS